MSTFRSPLVLRIFTIILLLLTNFSLTVTTLPSNPPFYRAPISLRNTLNTRENSISSATKNAAVQKRDDTATTANLPDVNPSTHGIPGIQSYTGASSKADQSQPLLSQDQTANSSSPPLPPPPTKQRQRARRAAAEEEPKSQDNFPDIASTMQNEEKQRQKGKGKRKERRNCIQPVMGPDGEWDYTVAGGSIVC